MELKEYQRDAILHFSQYLDLLAEEHISVNSVVNALETAGLHGHITDDMRDYPRTAWRRAIESGAIDASCIRRDADGIPLDASAQYHPTSDPTGRPVPNACMKVPTGGGKTLLAVHAVDAMLRKLGAGNTGFVLWVVPNEAIYTQTLRALRDRTSPYRQHLDLLAAGANKVRVLEKDDPLDSKDNDERLTIMLLMLQSASRESKQTLRMFRERGNVQGFVPAESDPEAHEKLLNAVPNLDVYPDPTGFCDLVQSSLGNALRIARPFLIVDEGHRAYSNLARRTLLGFNPSFLLELSATPPDRANKVVNVTGQALLAEEMIKLPIEVTVLPDVGWKVCLEKAADRLRSLSESAQVLIEQKGRYIRPIMLVQVERTGREKRDPKYVHTLDVIDHLLTMGFTKSSIAVKTSTENDLRDQANLSSPISPIRIVITKNALAEGWDCPFAYILCSLSATKSATAMTQLVGRILRQPDASRTGLEEFDSCYVFCHHTVTDGVIRGIKKALEDDGLGDIAGGAVRDSSAPTAAALGSRVRQAQFMADELAMPRLLMTRNGEVHSFDLDRDVLAEISWDTVVGSDAAESLPRTGANASVIVTRVGLNGVSTPSDRPAVATGSRFDILYATRLVSDIVANPWTAHRIVEEYLDALDGSGWSESELVGSTDLVVGHLCQWVENVRESCAREVFVRLLFSGDLQFRLRTDGNNWKLPKTLDVPNPAEGHVLVRRDGHAAKKSLLEPVWANEMNGLERIFAIYVDELEALKWWYRNGARRDWGVQGWRRGKVYPDFILGIARENGMQLSAVETKGMMLAGNADTTYKQDLLQTLTHAFKPEDVVQIGQLEVEIDQGVTIVCDLVFGDTWQQQLHEFHLDSPAFAVPETIPGE